MSIELLQGDSRNEHQLIDDLEALFWVFVFFALHYCRHSDRKILNESAIFDHWQPRISDNNEICQEGGDAKRALLAKRQLTNFPFACQPLKELISELRETWSLYQTRRLLACVQHEVTEKLAAHRAELSNPSCFARKLEEALEKPGWLPDDVVPNQFPQMTKHEARSRLAMVAMVAKSGNTSNDQSVDTRLAGTLRRKTSRASLRITKRKTTTADKSRKKAKLSQPVTGQNPKSKIRFAYGKKPALRH